jgi:hypothetical protein
LRSSGTPVQTFPLPAKKMRGGEGSVISEDTSCQHCEAKPRVGEWGRNGSTKGWDGDGGYWAVMLRATSGSDDKWVVVVLIAGGSGGQHCCRRRDLGWPRDGPMAFEAVGVGTVGGDAASTRDRRRRRRRR